jgi:hypothetical protein
LKSKNSAKESRFEWHTTTSQKHQPHPTTTRTTIIKKNKRLPIVSRHGKWTNQQLENAMDVVK